MPYRHARTPPQHAVETQLAGMQMLNSLTQANTQPIGIQTNPWAEARAVAPTATQHSLHSKPREIDEQKAAKDCPHQRAGHAMASVRLPARSLTDTDTRLVHAPHAIGSAQVPSRSRVAPADCTRALGGKLIEEGTDGRVRAQRAPTPEQDQAQDVPPSLRTGAEQVGQVALLSSGAQDGTLIPLPVRHRHHSIPNRLEVALPQLRGAAKQPHAAGELDVATASFKQNGTAFRGGAVLNDRQDRVARRFVDRGLNYGLSSFRDEPLNRCEQILFLSSSSVHEAGATISPVCRNHLMGLRCAARFEPLIMRTREKHLVKHAFLIWSHFLPQRRRCLHEQRHLRARLAQGCQAPQKPDDLLRAKRLDQRHRVLDQLAR
mmetsp:Transcript_36695/g.76634  ORF Transcript_36695/g.76634 Transcript_36695/m.76634 type:complete len:376 (-) Transcript_36695:2194-3321(-)